jgi:hypothetical protein
MATPPSWIFNITSYPHYSNLNHGYQSPTSTIVMATSIMDNSMSSYPHHGIAIESIKLLLQLLLLATSFMDLHLLRYLYSLLSSIYPHF